MKIKNDKYFISKSSMSIISCFDFHWNLLWITSLKLTIVFEKQRIFCANNWVPALSNVGFETRVTFKICCEEKKWIEVMNLPIPNKNLCYCWGNQWFLIFWLASDSIWCGTSNVGVAMGLRNRIGLITEIRLTSLCKQMAIVQCSKMNYTKWQLLNFTMSNSTKSSQFHS